MSHIVINQIDRNTGEIWRTFNRYPNEKNVESALHSIAFAFLPEATRVTVDGKGVDLQHIRDFATTEGPGNRAFVMHARGEGG